jgi:hypothetical protein
LLQELGDPEEEDARLEAELRDAELCGDLGLMERVAAEAGQSFEEAANAVAELVRSGVLVEQRDGNLKINEDRAADLFGKEAS